MDDLLGDFLAETGESLEIIDTEMVRLESDPTNRETLNNIFRLMHTVKGTAGFLDLPRLGAVAHAGETLLGRFREGSLEVTPDAVTVVLACIDRIKSIRDGLEDSGLEPSGDDAALIAEIEALYGDGDAEGSCGGSTPDVPDAVPETMTIEEDAAPSPTTGDPQTNPETGIGGSDLATPKAGPSPTNPPERNRTIRVNVDLLEQLITRVSELVLIRNQLLQMVRDSKESEFKAPLQRLSGITAELQETVLKTRMQPIGSLWAKLPRIVRDAAQDLGKSIRLKLEGEQTELDRQVLERIKDPLTHMIRNSCDHGIETSAERMAAGKPAAGTIALNAWHEGGYILIEIADDGRGLDAERIRTKALEKRVADEASLTAMNESQLLDLIFSPGFSTVSKVTNLSGRGVGMDVVRTNIEQLGGSVDLSSERGRCTRFTIKIPLTMTIVSALIVGTRGERLALPQSSVSELVRVGSRDDCRIERINHALVLRLRDHLMPVLPLREVLGLPAVSAGEQEFDRGFVVVMQVGTRKFGLMADAVFDTEEIVVKPLAKALGARPEYSGATIMGDGQVILILDPNGLAKASGGLEEQAGISTLEDERAEAVDEPKVIDILLFRCGDGAPRGCPLGLVTRLEALEIGCIANSRSGPVAKYRGHLMPLVGVADAAELAGDKSVPVIVFGQGDGAVGLAVDEILDIVEESLNIELGSSRPELLGTAVVKGEATELIDVAHYLKQARPDRPGSKATHGPQRRARTVLLVESQPFFRALLGPLLTAAGYEVTLADSAAEAASLSGAGAGFDAVLADIDERDDFDSLADLGRRCGTPVLALSGRDTASTPPEAVPKTDRRLLLDRLVQALRAPGEAA